MKLVYFDIDTLRADHLGCYGHRRPTSPNIDALAAEGVRLDNVYVSDMPCLPSRTALFSGRFGIQTGVVNHGGPTADPFPEGRSRGFRTAAALDSWTQAMRQAGLWTASISTFAERHSAYHFNAGFNETFNLGSRGMETADDVTPVAVEWLTRNARRDDWFLHVHLWDPHTPYRTPASFTPDLGGDPLPAWLTEDVRAQHWDRPGPHSAQEIAGFEPRAVWEPFERQPQQAGDLDAVRRIYDGYDVGVRYADHHIGRLLNHLADLGVLEETAVLVSSDHGETLGELGIYCDHQTADQKVARVPCILRWPGVELPAAAQADLHYQFDVAATLLELMGAEVPRSWDGASFAGHSGHSGSLDGPGRGHLVLSQGAWTAQRAVRFGDWLCLRTYDDGFHGFPSVMLFDLVADPFEQRDVAGEHPGVVDHALALLGEWQVEQMGRSATAVDPLWLSLQEGGPWHSRTDVGRYFQRLRDTGRGLWADRFERAREEVQEGKALADP